MWAHSKAAHTEHAYCADAGRFLAFVAKPLRAVTLPDVQAFAERLEGATQRRGVASVTSLLTFGQHLGYLPVNVCALLKLQTPKKHAQ